MLDCMKKRNSKGFTLAELLVVVAIIAILVAVSIPIFTGKLEEARLNTDEANIRAAKAVAISTFLQDESWQKEYADNGNKFIRFYDAKNGKLVGLEAGKKLDPYNKYDWDADNVRGTAVLAMIIQEDKGATSNTEFPIMITYAWEWPKQLDKVK